MNFQEFEHVSRIEHNGTTEQKVVKVVKVVYGKKSSLRLEVNCPRKSNYNLKNESPMQKKQLLKVDLMLLQFFSDHLDLISVNVLVFMHDA